MRKTFFYSILTISTASILIGCGGGGDSDTNISVDETYYNGAGSRWDLNFRNDGKTTIKELNSNLEINATYEDLSSGFKKITVTSSNSASKVKSGDITYGVELPDYMFAFVAFNENKLIPTVVKGSCPVEDIRHNFITSFAKSNTNLDGTIGDFDSWGTFGYWRTSKNSTQIEVFKRDGSRPDDGGSYTIGESIVNWCQNGEFYDPTGDPNDNYRAETTAYFTKTGGLIWQQRGLGNRVGNSLNDRLENDFMIPYEPNLNSIEQIDGDYLGYVVIGNGQEKIGYQNIPVNVTAENGVLNIKRVKDITTGALEESLFATVKLNKEVAGTKGLWQGEVETSEGVEGIGCAIDLNAGESTKNIVICGGLNPDGSKERLFSVILVSK